MVLVFIGIGFLLFVAGSEALLRGGTGISRAFGLPPPFIALIVAGFALSAPDCSSRLRRPVAEKPILRWEPRLGAPSPRCFWCSARVRSCSRCPRLRASCSADGGTLLVASVALVGTALSGVGREPPGILLSRRMGGLSRARFCHRHIGAGPRNAPPPKRTPTSGTRNSARRSVFFLSSSGQSACFSAHAS